MGTLLYTNYDYYNPDLYNQWRIQARGEGYAREIALFFETDLYGIQKQLDKLEVGGILASRKVGRTRLYVFNPRYPFLSELQALLAKDLIFYPETTRTDLTMNRRRPRRRGKPDEANLADDAA